MVILLASSMILNVIDCLYFEKYCDVLVSKMSLKLGNLKEAMNLKEKKYFVSESRVIEMDRYVIDGQTRVLNDQQK